MSIETFKKAFSASMSVTDGAREFVATISSNVVDRDGDIMVPEGMDATDFLKSPTVFWCHDYQKPIAKAVELKKNRDGWQAKSVMAARPAGHTGEWFPDTILDLIKQGIINGTSVGFAKTQARKPSVKEAEQYGPSLRQVISRWKMMEFSVTPMPVNQDALIHAVSKGLVSANTAKTLGVVVEDKKNLPIVENVVAPARRVIVYFPVTLKSIDHNEIARRVIAKRTGKLFA